MYPIIITTYFNHWHWISKTVYCISCSMVCKMIICSEFLDIPDKVGRKTRRRRKNTGNCKVLCILCKGKKGKERNLCHDWSRDAIAHYFWRCCNSFDEFMLQVLCRFHFKLSFWFKGSMIRCFHLKNGEKLFFRDCNLSSVKLYISNATSWKKLIEMIKYWKHWRYPFCTPLKFNKSHLIFL